MASDSKTYIVNYEIKADLTNANKGFKKIEQFAKNLNSLFARVDKGASEVRATIEALTKLTPKVEFDFNLAGFRSTIRQIETEVTMSAQRMHEALAAVFNPGATSPAFSKKNFLEAKLKDTEEMLKKVRKEMSMLVGDGTGRSSLGTTKERKIPYYEGSQYHKYLNEAKYEKTRDRLLKEVDDRAESLTRDERDLIAEQKRLQAEIKEAANKMKEDAKKPSIANPKVARDLIAELKAAANNVVKELPTIPLQFTVNREFLTTEVNEAVKLLEPPPLMLKIDFTEESLKNVRDKLKGLKPSGAQPESKVTPPPTAATIQQEKNKLDELKKKLTEAQTKKSEADIALANAQNTIDKKLAKTEVITTTAALNTAQEKVNAQQKLVEELEQRAQTATGSPKTSATVATSVLSPAEENAIAAALNQINELETKLNKLQSNTTKVTISLIDEVSKKIPQIIEDINNLPKTHDVIVSPTINQEAVNQLRQQLRELGILAQNSSLKASENTAANAAAATATSRPVGAPSAMGPPLTDEEQARLQQLRESPELEKLNKTREAWTKSKKGSAASTKKFEAYHKALQSARSIYDQINELEGREFQSTSLTSLTSEQQVKAARWQRVVNDLKGRASLSPLQQKILSTGEEQLSALRYGAAGAPVYTVNIGVNLDKSTLSNQINEILAKIEAKRGHIWVDVLLDDTTISSQLVGIQDLVNQTPIKIKTELEAPKEGEKEKDKKGKKKGAAAIETPAAVVAQEKAAEATEKAKGKTAEETLAQLKSNAIDVQINLLTDAAQAKLNTFISENNNKIITVTLEATPASIASVTETANAVAAAAETRAAAERAAGETPVAPVITGSTEAANEARETTAKDESDKPKETPEEKKKRNRRNNALRQYTTDRPQYRMLTENYDHFKQAFDILGKLNGPAGLSTTDWKKFTLEDKVKILNKTMSMMDADGLEVPYQMQAEVNSLIAQGAKITERAEMTSAHNKWLPFAKSDPNLKHIVENRRFYDEALDNMRSVNALVTDNLGDMGISDRVKILEEVKRLMEVNGGTPSYQLKTEIDDLNKQIRETEKSRIAAKDYARARKKFYPLAAADDLHLNHLIENERYYDRALENARARREIFSTDFGQLRDFEKKILYQEVERLMRQDLMSIPPQLRAQQKAVDAEIKKQWALAEEERRRKAHNKFFSAAKDAPQLKHMVDYEQYYDRAWENFKARGAKAASLADLGPAGRKWIINEVERLMRAAGEELPMRLKTDREAYQAKIDEQKSAIARQKALEKQQKLTERLNPFAKDAPHLKHLMEYEKYYTQAFERVKRWLSFFDPDNPNAPINPKAFTNLDKWHILDDAIELMRRDSVTPPPQMLKDLETYRRGMVDDRWGLFAKTKGGLDIIDKYIDTFEHVASELNLDPTRPLTTAQNVELLQGVQKQLVDAQIEPPQELSNRLAKEKEALLKDAGLRKELVEQTKAGMGLDPAKKIPVSKMVEFYEKLEQSYIARGFEMPADIKELQTRERYLEQARAKTGINTASPEKLTSGKAVQFFESLERAYAADGLTMPKEWQAAQKAAQNQRTNQLKSWASGHQFVNTAEQRKFVAENWRALVRAAKDLSTPGNIVNPGTIMEFTNFEKLDYLEKVRGYIARGKKEVPLMLDKEIKRLEGLVDAGLGDMRGGGFGEGGGRMGKMLDKKEMSLFDRARKWAYPFSGSTSFGANTPMVVDMAKGMGVMFAVGGAMSAIGDSFSQAMEYQNTMETTRAILQHGTDTYSTSNFTNMEHIIRDVGIKTKFSAPEVASAARFLAMAGQNIESINESIRPIADIALIGGTDLGETADKMTNIMTTFDIKPERMREVANILTTTATRSNTDLMMLAESAKYGGGVAQMYGRNDPNLFADTMALFGVMGNAGIQGSSAGTALRMMYQNIFNPNKNQAKVLAALESKYGIKTKNADGSFRGMAEFISDVAKNVKNDQEMAAIVSKLFRITAQPGANATLMAAVGGDIDAYQAVLESGKKMEDDLLKAGGMSKLAQLMQANRMAINGNISGETAEKMQNTIQGLWAQVTSTFTEGIVKAFETRQGGFEGILKDLRDYLARPETVTMLKNLLDLITNIGEVMAKFVAIWAKVYATFPGVVELWATLQMYFTQFGALVSPIVAMLGVFNRFGGWFKGLMPTSAAKKTTDILAPVVTNAVINSAANVAESATELAASAVSETVASAVTPVKSAAVVAEETMAEAAENLTEDLPELILDSEQDTPAQNKENKKPLSRKQKKKAKNLERKKAKAAKLNAKNAATATTSTTVTAALEAQAAAEAAAQVSPVVTGAAVDATAVEAAVIGSSLASGNNASAPATNQAQASKPGLKERFNNSSVKKSFSAGRSLGKFKSFKLPSGIFGMLGSLAMNLLSSISWIAGLIASPIGLWVIGLTTAGAAVYQFTKLLNGTTEAQIRAYENTAKLADQAHYEREKHSKWFSDFMNDPENPLNKKFGNGFVAEADMTLTDKASQEYEEMMQLRKKLYPDLFEDDLTKDISHQRTEMAAEKWKNEMLDNPVFRLALGDKYLERVKGPLNPERSLDPSLSPTSGSDNLGAWVINTLFGDKKNAIMVENQRAYDMLYLEGAKDPRVKNALNELSDLFNQYLSKKITKDVYDLKVAELRDKYIPKNLDAFPSAEKAGLDAKRLINISDLSQFQEYQQGYVNFLEASFDPEHEYSILAFANSLNELTQNKMQAFSESWNKHINNILGKSKFVTMIETADKQMKRVELNLRMLPDGKIDQESVFRQIKGAIDGYEDNILAFAKLSASVYKMLVDKGFIPNGSLQGGQQFVADQLADNSAIDAVTAGAYYDNVLAKGSPWTQRGLTRDEWVDWMSGTLIQQVPELFAPDGKSNFVRSTWFADVKRWAAKYGTTTALGENYDEIKKREEEEAKKKSKKDYTGVDQSAYASTQEQAYNVSKSEWNIEGGLINATINIATTDNVEDIRNQIIPVVTDCLAEAFGLAQSQGMMMNPNIG